MVTKEEFNRRNKEREAMEGIDEEDEDDEGDDDEDDGNKWITKKFVWENSRSL